MYFSKIPRYHQVDQVVSQGLESKRKVEFIHSSCSWNSLGLLRIDFLPGGSGSLYEDAGSPYEDTESPQDRLLSIKIWVPLLGCCIPLLTIDLPLWGSGSLCEDLSPSIRMLCPSIRIWVPLWGYWVSSGQTFLHEDALSGSRHLLALSIKSSQLVLHVLISWSPGNLWTAFALLCRRQWWECVDWETLIFGAFTSVMLIVSLVSAASFSLITISSTNRIGLLM